MKTSCFITDVLITRYLASHLTALTSHSSFENQRETQNRTWVASPSGRGSTKLLSTSYADGGGSGHKWTILFLTRKMRRCLMSIGERDEWDLCPYLFQGAGSHPLLTFLHPCNYIFPKAQLSPFLTSFDVEAGLPPSFPHWPPSSFLPRWPFKTIQPTLVWCWRWDSHPGQQRWRPVLWHTTSVPFYGSSLSSSFFLSNSSVSSPHAHASLCPSHDNTVSQGTFASQTNHSLWFWLGDKEMLMPCQNMKLTPEASGLWKGVLFIHHFKAVN